MHISGNADLSSSVDPALSLKQTLTWEDSKLRLCALDINTLVPNCVSYDYWYSEVLTVCGPPVRTMSI